MYFIKKLTPTKFLKNNDLRKQIFEKGKIFQKTNDLKVTNLN